MGTAIKASCATPG